MADFIRAYEQLILAEGGYKLHKVKNDTGGWTYAGITRKWFPDWPGWSYIDNNQQPPVDLVRAFYHARIWLRHRLDEVIDQDVAECIFLAAANAEASVKVLQLTLKGLTPDGHIGDKTLAAINAADPATLIPFYTLAKVDRYRQICNRDRTQIGFLLGWLNRSFKEAARG